MVKMKKYDRMTDEQLIQELRKGDRAIMDYIMDKYKSMVRKKARAMFLLGGENDDLIQGNVRIQRKMLFPLGSFNCTVHLP